MKNFNNTLKEIAETLLEANTVLLYPHVLMDGDTLGSSVAICKALRMLGKDCWILIEDDIAAYLRFLDNGYCTSDGNKIINPDICMCVDCADIDRFVKRKEKFLECRTTICIDHHTTSQQFADYNYIDSGAAATGEIVYDLLCEMGVSIDQEMGEAIFAAITTDTGNFQYSNTTKKTHLTIVALYDIGIDVSKVSVEIYDNIRREKLLISGRVLNTLKIFAGGKAAIAYVTREMLEEANATLDETEGVVETLRSISGVEIAAFLKEAADGRIKVSMRAKTYGNVAEIGAFFQGGGHIKAAGCTIAAPIEEAGRLIMEKIEKQLS